MNDQNQNLENRQNYDLHSHLSNQCEINSFRLVKPQKNDYKTTMTSSPSFHKIVLNKINNVI